MKYNPVFLYLNHEVDIQDELEGIKAHINTETIKLVQQSSTQLKLENVPLKLAIKLKEYSINNNAVVIYNRDVDHLSIPQTDVIYLGTELNLQNVINMMMETPDARDFAKELQFVLESKHRANSPQFLNTTVSNYNLSERTYIMGILNVTPNSFSDGGRYNQLDKAVEHAKRLVQAGADIIDIGGESTRPGAEKVTLEEELERVIPIISAVRQAVNVPISVDTYKAEVAKQAIEAGANILNDVWRAIADSKMAEVAARYDVPIILMHNRHNKRYKSLISDMVSDLRESIEIVKNAGVKDENIILDPGIGFAKSYEDNIKVMRHLKTICSMGYPVLLATSRKTFIGTTLDLPTDERVEGTGATTCLGIQQGCQMVRVHDVRENIRMAKMMDTMMGKGESSIG